MLRARSCALLVLVGLAIWVPPAFGEEAVQGAVSVACTSLGTESQSALAARAEAELLVRGTGGALSILCVESSATLRFVGMDAAERQAVLVLPPETSAAIDRILEALDQLLPQALRPSSPVVAQPPPVLAPPVAAPLPPAPVPLAALPVAREREEPSEDVDRAGVEIAAGGETELWSSEVLGAIGPRLGLSWAPEPLWALRVSGGPSWGLRAPANVSGSLLRLEVGAELHIGPARAFRLAATVLGDRLAAGSDEQSTAELAFGGAVRASVGTWLGDMRCSGGPLLLVHPGAVRVELGTRELFRIPAVTAGLGVEVSVAPWEGP